MFTKDSKSQVYWNRIASSSKKNLEYLSLRLKRFLTLLSLTREPNLVLANLCASSARLEL